MKLSKLNHFSCPDMGARLKGLRNEWRAMLKEEKGTAKGEYTQSAMADLCGVAENTYNSWEHGVEMPLQQAYGLSCLFDVSLDYLCGRPGAVKDMNIAEISKLTGLSYDAIKSLIDHNNKEKYNQDTNPLADTISDLCRDYDRNPYMNVVDAIRLYMGSSGNGKLQVSKNTDSAFQVAFAGFSVNERLVIMEYLKEALTQLSRTQAGNSDDKGQR